MIITNYLKLQNYIIATNIVKIIKTYTTCFSALRIIYNYSSYLRCKLIMKLIIKLVQIVQEERKKHLSQAGASMAAPREKGESQEGRGS